MKSSSSRAVTQSPLTAHRAHNYHALIRRWRAVARKTGLKLQPFAREGEYPLFLLRSRLPLHSGALYISAGIHGDEPAGTEALIAWAENNVRALARLPFIFFPCLNPWGLVNNHRADAKGRDLNRVFDSAKSASISAVKKAIRGCQFSLAMTLHEDFDGQGLYLYEVKQAAETWGEDLLEVARPIMPIEGRTSIDGRKARAGLMRRKINELLLQKFKTIGLPEAVYLHLHHSARTYTVETPSEFALDQRVRAHLAVIDECVRRAFPENV